MRIWLGRLLLLIGGFALAAAIVSVTWGVDSASRIPLDTNVDTRLEGTASGLLVDEDDTDAVKPIKYLNNTKVDPDASDDNVITLVQVSCMVVDEGDPPDCPEKDDSRLIQIGAPEAMAVDRATGVPAKDQEEYLGEDPERPVYEGQATKMPFNVEQKDYMYWDKTLAQAVPLLFEGEVEVAGRNTYKFVADVPETEGVQLNEETEGEYASTTTLWVDPRTGAYIDQQVDTTLTTAGSTVLDVSMKYSDETVQNNIDDAEANGQKLKLIGFWIPLIGGIAGGVCVLVGAVLVAMGRSAKRRAAHAAAPDDSTTTGLPVA